MGCIADDGYIHFEDPNVLQVLLNAGIGDGIGITIEDATSANLGTLFKNNSVIVSFDEFKYFTRPNTTVDFSGCSNLERIDLTNCTVMPKFSDCSSLAYFNGPNSVQGVMVIPEGVTNLSSGTLARCASITELHFPDSFTTLWNDSCRQMTNLTKIYFGSGIQDCSNPFYGDNALSEVHIPDIDTWLDIAFGNNAHSSPLTKAHHLYVDGVEVTSVDFTGRTTVGRNTLSGGTSITSVVLPSTITSIGDRAFQDCTNLVIPDLNLPSLASLGSYAFSGTKVQSISDLGAITSIQESCFSGCSQLTTIEQGVLDNITVLGKEAFNNCTNLGSAKQSDNTISSVLRLPNLTSIELDAVRYTKFTEIADLGSITTVTGFSEMANLTSVVLPQTCTTIGNSAFVNDKALTTIDISNITSIGTSAFIGCNNLIYFYGAGSVAGELDLSNVTSIGRSAFRNCSSLTSVTINAVTPPTLGTNAFDGTNNCPIYVPAGSVSTYQTAANWSTYASRIQAIPTN